MKYLVITLAIVSVSLILGGVYYDFFTADDVMKNKLYGLGTVSLFFLTIPVFLFYRRNKTDIKKYILDDEILFKKKKKN